MSDLTRRVLKADQSMDRSPVTDWNKFDAARLTCANAAPTLARQVEAVEALADRLEWEADPDTHGDHDYGFDDTRNAIAARIRDALNGGTNA